MRYTGWIPFSRGEQTDGRIDGTSRKPDTDYSRASGNGAADVDPSSWPSQYKELRCSLGIFDAIRALMEPPKILGRRIGYLPGSRILKNGVDVDPSIW
jgi:hypothetical protein